MLLVSVKKVKIKNSIFSNNYAQYYGGNFIIYNNI